MGPTLPPASLEFDQALPHVRPYFQPVVDLRRRRIVGYEALARGPEGSPWELPAALFEAAASRGLLPEVEKQVRDRALLMWRTRFPRLRLFLNSHPCQWSTWEQEAYRLLLATRKGSGPTRGRLVLELSERLTAAQAEQAFRHTRRLRAAGLQLWLDDLGSGAAGLASLLLVRPDGVKLDRLMIADVHADPLRRALVRSLVQTAADLGLALVAEGVETLEELKCLAELGISLVQGFLLGRPQPQPQPLSPEVLGVLADIRGAGAHP